MADKRIKDLVNTNTADNTDYLAVDDSTKGTRKLSFANLVSQLRSIFDISAITSKANGAMQKTVYDPNNDGVVTDSDKLGGVVASEYALNDDLSAVATSGSYNDLSNKPTIPTALSELSEDSTHKLMTSAERTKLAGIETGAQENVQSNWNQSDNTKDDYIANKPDLSDMATKTWVSDNHGGTYTKPSSGIPKDDLSVAVKVSLNNADSAIQSLTDYRTADEQDVIDATKIGDAPMDNKEYVRKNASWVEKSQTGTVDHRDLTNKDASNQHPMSSITGLNDLMENVAEAVSDIYTRKAEDSKVEQYYSSLQSGKVGKPSTSGTDGQVLATDGSGGTYWKTVSGGGGTGDHRDLSNRDASNQHPISAITGLETALGGITEKIPSSASSSNKLVSQNEMSEAIASVEAKQLYSTSSQGSFSTKAQLTSATTFYNADGTVATPTKNDIAYVLADESHSGKSAKYVIAEVSSSGIVWGFVITFSDITFSQAQMDAINSGIDSSDVAKIDTAVQPSAISDMATKTWTNAQGFVKSADLSDVATSGSYDDLDDKPSIPTEATVSGWGFTKNTGTYSKPSSGIPKTDLDSYVQASLSKADSALQAHQSLSAYRTSSAQDVIDSGKQRTIYQQNEEPLNPQVGDLWIDLDGGLVEYDGGVV